MPTLDGIGKKAVLNHHRQVPYHIFKQVPFEIKTASGRGGAVQPERLPRNSPSG